MKDPAILFYTADFLTGTMFMTNEEVGAYIRLLCVQHQKGHLKEKDMLNICQTYLDNVYEKFIKDNNNNYYNERLELEANKRKAYSESRSTNRKGTTKDKEDMSKISKTYVKHMENENRDININKKYNNVKVLKHKNYTQREQEDLDKFVDVGGK
jgi:uncharacterized protein YdaU (DUF1376 family)